MTTALTHGQLEALLMWLNPSEPDCRIKIAQLRQAMDEACDQRYITIYQWRILLDRVSLVQAKLVQFEPDAWRRPTQSGSGAHDPQ